MGYLKESKKGGAWRGALYKTCLLQSKVYLKEVVDGTETRG